MPVIPIDPAVRAAVRLLDELTESDEFQASGTHLKETMCSAVCGFRGVRGRPHARQAVRHHPRGVPAGAR